MALTSSSVVTGLLIQLLLFASPPAEDGRFEPGGGWNATRPEALTGRPDAYSVKFIPLAALGGALWATGNTLSVPVINLVGLSLGLLLWGSANMVRAPAASNYDPEATTDDTDPACGALGTCTAANSTAVAGCMDPSESCWGP